MPSWVRTGAAGLAVVATGPLVLSEKAGEPFSISQPFYTRTPSSCACNRFAPNTFELQEFEWAGERIRNLFAELAQLKNAA